MNTVLNLMELRDFVYELTDKVQTYVGGYSQDEEGDTIFPEGAASPVLMMSEWGTLVDGHVIGCLAAHMVVDEGYLGAGLLPAINSEEAANEYAEEDIWRGNELEPWLGSKYGFGALSELLGIEEDDALFIFGEEENDWDTIIRNINVTIEKYQEIEAQA